MYVSQRDPLCTVYECDWRFDELHCISHMYVVIIDFPCLLLAYHPIRDTIAATCFKFSGLFTAR